MIGRKVIIMSENLMLLVKIIGTMGVSDGSPYQYKVTAWTHSNKIYETKVVASEGDPEFNEVLQIQQDEDSPAEFIYLKVSKRNSAGTTLVGTAKTLLPPVKGQEFYVEVKLSDPNQTGLLQLSLHLMTLETLGYAS